MEQIYDVNLEIKGQPAGKMQVIADSAVGALTESLKLLELVGLNAVPVSVNFFNRNVVE